MHVNKGGLFAVAARVHLKKKLFEGSLTIPTQEREHSVGALL